MDSYHKSVLLNEVRGELSIEEGTIVDCTFGGGGHFRALIENMQKGIALGIDQDTDALEHVGKDDLKKDGVKVILREGNFKDISQILEEEGIEKFDRLIADLGVSSYQLDTPEKGFSFRGNGELDMRMSRNLGVKAKDLVNGLYEAELAKVIWEFGEERMSRRLAKAITEARDKQQIETTEELFKIIEETVPYKDPKFIRDVSQRVFQALRIAVNDELAALQSLLSQALEKLSDGGKMGIISFHSLEDRIVKGFIKQNNLKNTYITPTEAEIEANSRSRSAKLRIITR